MSPESENASTGSTSVAMTSAVPARYEIVRALGSGGMGDVYLARDKQLPRQVAIKTIRKDLADQPEIGKRIERECRLHAQIGSHPNIVTLHDRVEHGGSICLVMEYVAGQTLQYVLEQGIDNGNPLDWTESVRIARQCLDALGRIHAHGIVHRDVKPANILLGKNDDGQYVAKLMDFGIARLTTETDGMTVLTQEGTGGPGTPVYMAPEQIDSKKYGDVSPATDVYAMGIVFYQMLSGKPPFTGSLTEVFNGHLNQSPPPIPFLGSDAHDIELVIQNALAKNPLHRYRTTQDFREALDSLAPMDIVHRPAVAKSPTPSEPSVEKTVVASDPHPIENAAGRTMLDGTGGTRRRQRTSVRLGPLVGIATVLIFVAVGTFAAMQFTGGDDRADEDDAAQVSDGSEANEPQAAPNVAEAAAQASTLPPLSDEARPLPGPDFTSSRADEDADSEFSGSALDALRERRSTAADRAPVPTSAAPPDSAPVTPVSTPPAQTNNGGGNATATGNSTKAADPAPKQTQPPAPVTNPPDKSATAKADEPAPEEDDDPLAGFNAVKRTVTKQ